VQFHQVLVTASPDDAISHAAFEIRDLLRQAGPSEIFAHHIHPSVADEVLKLERLDRYPDHEPRSDVLLYHASIGDPTVHEFITARAERLVLVYHNISPAEAYASYNPSFAGLLEAGRRDLALLRDRVTLALADSAFNASELIALGYPDVRVSPLIIDSSALHSVDLDEATTNHLNTRVEGPLILFVGQILPHKRPELLVQAFHVLSTYLIPEAKLVLVGNTRISRFSEAVQTQIAELGLSGAWLTGTVPPSTLRSFYERADLFATASDHEGFCVPLLEAMSFDLPVVARATTAIPETLAGAGLLVDREDGPIVLAEALAEVITNGELRAELVRSGHGRLDAFDPDRARGTLLEHLLSVA
jgi:glycosyltransferase involved in cell wall biosynthesis